MGPSSREVGGKPIPVVEKGECLLWGRGIPVLITRIYPMGQGTPFEGAVAQKVTEK